ncbi:phosphodiester glycosidase family protein [Hyalangium versicolor]|uniref:phosphodiester glycosidase family protein n=1 Tax=Hyalangium versicolor TaxID=2861190 RepID=UPI001CCB3308|nr:phosphodiester glycosidase family protein [Hyalangium versicolor]
MRVLGIVVWALALGAVPSLAGEAKPPATSKEAQASPIEARTVRFQDESFHVVTVDLKRASVRLIRQDEQGHALETFEALEKWLSKQGESLLAATNAGIFEPGLVPTGVFVQDGRELAPINPKTGQGNFFWKPNGVFLLGSEGARIVDASQYRGDSKPRQATQSGPLLLLAGQMHPGFKDSKGTATRSGVGVENPQRIHIVLSAAPVRLETFAELFRTQLGCSDALYLDGNISRLYPPALQGGRADTAGSFSGFLVVTPLRK